MNSKHHRLISMLLLLLGLAASHVALSEQTYYEVNSADPATVIQGATLNLDVTITGDLFDKTIDEVNFRLRCEPGETCVDNGVIKVNRFKVRGPTKIIANIDISATASLPDAYLGHDIEVSSTSRGRGGKGTTLFKVQSGNSHEDQYFEVTFEGAVRGTVISNPISILGNVQIIGFYAFSSEIEFDPAFINKLEDDGYTGFYECFGNEIVRFNIQIYEDYVDRELTLARFWFFTSDSDDQTDDSLQYALDLSDTGGENVVWSGQFPPAENSDPIVRTAESWGIRPTKKKVKTACSGEGDFEENGGYEVKVTLTRIHIE